jgi:hypothetical protein
MKKEEIEHSIVLRVTIQEDDAKINGIDDPDERRVHLARALQEILSMSAETDVAGWIEEVS